MRRLLALILLLVGNAAWGQDSSFSQVTVRAAGLRLPEIGHLGDHWRARTGAQIELASNVGRGELAIALARIGFRPTDGRPPFTETIISLGLTREVLLGARGGIAIGARLSDIRFDFDDPAMVAGLRNEEELLLSALARGRVGIGRRVSVFGEASYGILMLSTKTPTAMAAVGVESGSRMPGWLRDFLR